MPLGKLDRQVSANQLGPERSAAGQQAVIEVVMRVVNVAAALGNVRAVTDEHLAPGNALQHESKVFGSHQRQYPQDSILSAANSLVRNPSKPNSRWLWIFWCSAL